jgi:hypothetical protein
LPAVQETAATEEDDMSWTRALLVTGYCMGMAPLALSNWQAACGITGTVLVVVAILRDISHPEAGE